MSIAEVSVIVTGTVALGTPLINGLLASLQSKRTERSSRLDELRSVFDDAAVALMEFMHSVPTDEDHHHPDGVANQLPGMYRALTRMSEHEARISVRLGVESEVSKAYASARESATVCFQYYQEMRGAPRFDHAELRLLGDRQTAANLKFFDLAAVRTGPDRS